MRDAHPRKKDATGKAAGSVDLDDTMFGIEPNIPVMHQVVTAQLAARRSGTQSTKTRAEVRGGGRQALEAEGHRPGPRRLEPFTDLDRRWRDPRPQEPRDYAQRTPKKMIRLALKSALSDRVASERVIVLDWGLDAPSTKGAHAAMAANGVEGKVLVVLRPEDEAIWKSLRNLDHVHICGELELNAYDVLVSDWVVFTPDTLPVDRPISRGSHATGRSREKIPATSSSPRS